ncbi:MAG: radical SAM protein [Melioribacteraceae bacterium]|nr:radical SAM protein [Melioribacteraceae bacterium]MCF8353583.1 radical SAM protein [Melioribacteraceae bacterium]MCF8393506.1 radical SAM protein [Melioribacteraceae bacterium]MCF8419316.1 radical SAM protein [Melioribacteraceae bacterium]
MKTLLIIPPFTQINTTYSSVTQLAGYLKSKGYDTECSDLSLNVFLKIFCRDGLSKIFDEIDSTKNKNDTALRMLALKENYLFAIEPVIKFLQGKDPSLAYKIISENYMPHGDSFSIKIDESSAFGDVGLHDKAKYYSSMMIDDIVNLIQKNITPHFGLSRYAERLSSSTPEFLPILKELHRKPNIIEQFIINETNHLISKTKPDLVGFTIPFPGNLLGALVSAKHIRAINKNIKIVFGGGYVNTELRNISDAQIFNYIDYLTFDDGELPLFNIIRNIESPNHNEWTRTLTWVDNKLTYLDNSIQKNVHHNELNPPSLDGITPDEYVSMTEMLNPMHRLWSDGYWNKLTAAHGCYWRKCTFCDVTLDYIGRYSPAKASTVVDWMEELIRQSGRTSFHFTDEAAPPALLREIATEILRRRLSVTWWGNIRFEKAFTFDLCRLLAASGFVAVSGGLEVADDRLLKLIDKGVTVEQVANSCKNFVDAGIMVHSYLMYGFPTQTEQEIINSLEIVRQMINHGLIHSGYWHLFALTIHSPVAKQPGKYSVEITSSTNNKFANNDLVHKDLTGVDHKKYSAGLNKALYNYMHGVGLDWEVDEWFDFETQKTTVDKNLIENYIRNYTEDINPNARAIWIGGEASIKKISDAKSKLTIHTNALEGSWELKDSEVRKVTKIINSCAITNSSKHSIRFSDLAELASVSQEDIIFRELREIGLLFI